MSDLINTKQYQDFMQSSQFYAETIGQQDVAQVEQVVPLFVQNSKELEL